jgi:putative ABC transport system ATP-binding protein
MWPWQKNFDGGINPMSIHTKQLTKIYNRNTNFPVKAVDEVDLTIDQGEFVAVMGPSGSGKTTFLNMIG